MLVRAVPEHQRVDGQQRVEPPARLVDGLGDEIGREGEGLHGPGRVRVTDLRRRHRSRIEPGVDDRCHPPRDGVLVAHPGFSAGRAVEHHVVDDRTMRIDARHIPAAELGELGERTDAVQMPAPAAPDGQRCSPVAVTGERPVDVVGQPFAEPAVADVRRVPVDGGVLGQHLVLAGGRGDVPARLAPVDERGAAAPAVRVRVHVGIAAHQKSGFLQAVVDHRVARAHVLPRQPPDLVGEPSVGTRPD